MLIPSLGEGQRVDQIDTYHLGNSMKFYGRLQEINDEYLFFPADGCEELTNLADYFRDIIIAWYE